jgi:hypothetical protein
MLTGLIGNGLAVLVAGVAWMCARFRHHVPGGAAADEVLLTMAVVGMLFAGDLMAATGLGAWLSLLIRGAEHMIGAPGVIVAALVTLFVLLRTGVAIFRNASEGAMRLAFALPFLLALFPTGFFHTVGADLQGPAQALAARLAAGMGV